MKSTGPMTTIVVPPGDISYRFDIENGVLWHCP